MDALFTNTYKVVLGGYNVLLLRYDVKLKHYYI